MDSIVRTRHDSGSRRNNIVVSIPLGPVSTSTSARPSTIARAFRRERYAITAPRSTHTEVPIRDPQKLPLERVQLAHPDPPDFSIMHVGAKYVAQGFRAGRYSGDYEPMDGQGREGKGGEVRACNVDIC